MITIHHLRIGRSIFTVWLLEELGLDYELIEYRRNPETFRADPALKAVHPLGKSPVIEDDGAVIAESGAITAYLLENHDPEHRLAPAPGDKAARRRFLYWLHYPEGSVFLPLFLTLLAARAPDAAPVLRGFAGPEIELHLDHIAQELGESDYIMGETFSAADIALGFAIGFAEQFQLLEERPTLKAYAARLRSRPAFEHAVARAVE